MTLLPANIRSNIPHYVSFNLAKCSDFLDASSSSSRGRGLGPTARTNRNTRNVHWHTLYIGLSVTSQGVQVVVDSAQGGHVESEGSKKKLKMTSVPQNDETILYNCECRILLLN